jgi:hypothetical protein
VREALSVHGDDDPQRVDVERVTAAMFEDERVRVHAERDARGRRRVAWSDADGERDRDATREHHSDRHHENDTDDRTGRTYTPSSGKRHADRGRGFALERSGPHSKTG